ncbi:MAG: amidohydrolase family protein [Bryobacterales bacterium]|nr:amidohydrolase family protein [Bryobacterales bacterium]
MRILAPVVLLFVSASIATGETLVLRSGTIWISPEDKPVRKGSVLIEDGRIVSTGKVRVPRGAVVLDCTGMTILAGFRNSHAHFFERKWENAATLPAAELERQIESMTTRYGFTAVFDLGSVGDTTRAIRRRIEKGEIHGPHIRTTGEVIAAPGAIPAANLLRMLGNTAAANHEVSTAEQAVSATRALLDSGVDGIKIHLQRPLADAVVRAIVEAAHRAGKPVFAHPNSAADMLACARAGVDVLTHTTPFSEWDAAVIPTLLGQRVAITPTLAMWRFLLRHDRLSTQQRAADTAKEQLKAWARAGGTVLFGSDLGAVEYDPSEEYERMAQAGMSFAAVLAALTTAPAERFREARQTGRVASGLAADLVVVEGDPAKDIRALSRVRYTVRNGRVIYRMR